MQLGSVESAASRLVTAGRQRARVQGESCWIHGLAGYALSGAGVPRCLGRQSARAGSNLQNPRSGRLRAQRSGEQKLQDPWPGWKGKLKRQDPRLGGSRAPRKARERCLERGPSSWGRSGFILGLLPRLFLLLLVRCTRRSIHIDETLA